ncbi:Diphthamide biosynthesis protein 2 [Leucoagaricus gongylophorus]
MPTSSGFSWAHWVSVCLFCTLIRTMYLISVHSASYLPLITYLRKILASHHKKSYVISVGRLTQSKLANFLEIECFVLVACPENSLIESKEFLKPIITPYEMEMSLKQEVSWTGRYVLDFDQVMEGGKGKEDNRQDVDESRDDKLSRVKVDNEDIEGDAQQDFDKPQFSLVTGKYRHARRYVAGIETTLQSAQNLTGSGSIILRDQNSAISRLGDDAAGIVGRHGSCRKLILPSPAHFLQERAYRGLEVRLDEDAPSVLEQGRRGIARNYQTDYGAYESEKDQLL